MKRHHLLALAVTLLAALATACGPTVARPVPPSTATDALGVVVTLAAGQAVTLTAPAPKPLPPPTPLPTPTPIIYVVQSGDTLLAIAMKYGVSLAALQAANGNVQPEFLQIGQELIIPQPGGDDTSSAGAVDLLMPTPTPLPIQLGGMGWHETPTGSLWVFGEVVNPTSAEMTHVQLLVVLVGPNGERLGEMLAFPALDLIAPGGRVPFGVLFPAIPDGVANFHADVLSAETYAHDGPFVPGFHVTSDSGGPAGGLFRVTGALRNDGTVAAAADVVVTLYDEVGSVIGFERQRSGVLAPGAAGTFDVRVTPAGAGVVRYAVAAQGTK